jgi:hypothetical protein
MGIPLVRGLWWQMPRDGPSIGLLARAAGKVNTRRPDRALKSF